MHARLSLIFVAFLTEGSRQVEAHSRFPIILWGILNQREHLGEPSRCSGRHLSNQIHLSRRCGHEQALQPPSWLISSRGTNFGNVKLDQVSLWCQKRSFPCYDVESKAVTSFISKAIVVRRQLRPHRTRARFKVREHLRARRVGSMTTLAGSG